VSGRNRRGARTDGGDREGVELHQAGVAQRQLGLGAERAHVLRAPQRPRSQSAWASAQRAPGTTGDELSTKQSVSKE
jgi:hypothetical protein